MYIIAGVTAKAIRKHDVVLPTRDIIPNWRKSVVAFYSLAPKTNSRSLGNDPAIAFYLRIYEQVKSDAQDILAVVSAK